MMGIFTEGKQLECKYLPMEQPISVKTDFLPMPISARDLKIFDIDKVELDPENPRPTSAPMSPDTRFCKHGSSM